MPARAFPTHLGRVPGELLLCPELRANWQFAMDRSSESICGATGSHCGIDELMVEPLPRPDEFLCDAGEVLFILFRVCRREDDRRRTLAINQLVYKWCSHSSPRGCFSAQRPKPFGMWCGGRESNPHVPCGTRDFKSLASTSSATPARYKRVRL